MTESNIECTHNCSTCSADCGSRNQEQADFRAPLNAQSSVKKVIGIVSGKGGVGKSLVTTLLAVKMNSLGRRTAILDADITGPSIPRAFGLTRDSIAMTGDGLMLPATSATGIQVMSANLMLEHDTDPVIWRGAMIAGAVRQFWQETLWKNVDCMFVDMPPGTGDVPLTVFQSLPVDGIVIVTSPQELVSMIVTKAVNMAKKMDIPILGLVENLSYLECPDCKKKIFLFGESHIDDIAEEYGIPVLAKIPIDPEIAAHVDAGTAEYLDSAWMDEAVKRIL